MSTDHPIIDELERIVRLHERLDAPEAAFVRGQGHSEGQIRETLGHAGITDPPEELVAWYQWHDGNLWILGKTTMTMDFSQQVRDGVAKRFGAVPAAHWYLLYDQEFQTAAVCDGRPECEIIRYEAPNEARFVATSLALFVASYRELLEVQAAKNRGARLEELEHGDVIGRFFNVSGYT